MNMPTVAKLPQVSGPFTLRMRDASCRECSHFLARHTGWGKLARKGIQRIAFPGAEQIASLPGRRRKEPVLKRSRLQSLLPGKRV